MILYNTFIILLGWVIRILALFSQKQKEWIDGRNRWKHVWSAKCNDLKGVRVWFHCASLGEYEQAKPVIKEITARWTNINIIITFFSPSGFKIVSESNSQYTIMYIPLDTPSNAKFAVATINPDLVCFVKYEFWYNHLKEINERKIPLFLISGIFRPNMLFFKWYGIGYKIVLTWFNQLFIQNHTSEVILTSHHINNYTLTGDTRCESSKSNTLTAWESLEIKNYCNNRFTVIVGSSWLFEEKIILDSLHFFKENNIALIIAPHDISRAESIKNKFKGKYLNDELNDINYYPLIINSIGQLKYIYRYASLAIVGGGFTGQLHNILEPAAYQLPVLLGPKFDRFPEAVEMINLHAACIFKNSKDLTMQISTFKNDRKLLKSTGDNAGKFVDSGIGATQIIMEYLSPIIINRLKN